MLVASYNPGYQRAIKDLKPSTRQRFVTLEFQVPSAAMEAEIVAHEGGVDLRTARSLVSVAERVRRLRDQGLTEGPGTRLLVSAARLISNGIAPRDACHAALSSVLTDGTSQEPRGHEGSGPALLEVLSDGLLLVHRDTG